MFPADHQVIFKKPFFTCSVNGLLSLGTMDTVAIIESWMEHIAWTLKKDPEEVRLANFSETERDVLVTIMNDLKDSADYEARKEAVKAFNAVNFSFSFKNKVRVRDS